MALVIVYNVIKRYVFNLQDPYAYVVTIALMLLSVVFAISQTQNLRQHLRVDILDRYFPAGILVVFQNLIAPLMGLVCISILVWKSWNPAWIAFETGDTYGSGVARLPTWPWKMTVIFAAGLLCLVLINQIVRYFASIIGRGIKHKAN
jgi:TRAP-type C4-dicarboxylate transport system permease small subunit